MTNRYLEQYGHDARIDHRSHADRGLTEQPAIHEGVAAHALEKEGLISDRCEINRQIKADNLLLKELKAKVKKLVQAVQNTILAIVEALEKLRENMIVFRYHLLHLHHVKKRIQGILNTLKPELERYMGLVRQIKESIKERKELLAEKKSTPILSVLRHRGLSRRIAELTEKLEELRSEKAMLLSSLEYSENTGVEMIRKDISKMEAGLHRLEQQEQKYSIELEKALAEYAALKEQAADFDPVELFEARQAIRPEKEVCVSSRLQDAYGERFDVFRLRNSKNDVSNMLGEEKEERFVQKQLQKLRAEQRQRDRQQAPKREVQDRGEER